MERLLFASFPDPDRAAAAAADLAARASAAPGTPAASTRSPCGRIGVPCAGSERAIRLHHASIDPLVAHDLGGTASQDACERDVLWRFVAPFAASVALGLGIDLAILRVVGLPATLLLGSIGVFLGTLAVLIAPLRPLDHALRDADDALDAGDTLLTAPTDDEGRRGAAFTVARHGGRTLFEA